MAPYSWVGMGWMDGPLNASLPRVPLCGAHNIFIKCAQFMCMCRTGHFQGGEAV